MLLLTVPLLASESHKTLHDDFNNAIADNKITESKSTDSKTGDNKLGENKLAVKTESKEPEGTRGRICSMLAMIESVKRR